MLTTGEKPQSVLTARASAAIARPASAARRPRVKAPARAWKAAWSCGARPSPCGAAGTQRCPCTPPRSPPPTLMCAVGTRHTPQHQPAALPRAALPTALPPSHHASRGRRSAFLSAEDHGPTATDSRGKVPYYYTAPHTTPHTNLHLNKSREALSQRKLRRAAPRRLASLAVVWGGNVVGWCQHHHPVAGCGGRERTGHR
jgi:hypothetical protein